ncbi:hypothetical protein CC80DRAFT_154703 [Byssothecium circinans]|uniref:Uncharacterized protein n=1 Tax=Byssothecium circinans TaxID=147558 RepID=A0A6A5UB35_9PLEO|nr:hypothetical protein CC80DRAFT_154703 [Byssothecium circinans]
MNWTGGSLQRWKNTPKGIAQKQKAHFARVRAQMQNGHRSSSPVRPNFFQKGEDRLGSQLPPPLSPRAFGHTGHSKTRQEQDTLHREASSGWFKRKQSSGDANAEEQLLEARRKRLLQQHDWAGLKALSRPAELQFRSPEEKKMIGKRRKPRDRGIRAVTKKPEVSLSRREFENSRPHGPYMNGTLPKEAISIRFGSDALTSAVPQTKSSASSDTMLFDNESLHTAAVESPMRIGDDHIPRTFVGAHEPEMRGEHWQSHRYSDLDHVRGISRQKGGSLENHYQSADARFQEEDRLSGCYIAQQVGGVTRPLRLIFDRTSDSSPSSAEKYGAAQGHDIATWQERCLD